MQSNLKKGEGVMDVVPDSNLGAQRGKVEERWDRSGTEGRPGVVALSRSVFENVLSMIASSQRGNWFSEGSKGGGRPWGEQRLSSWRSEQGERVSKWSGTYKKKEKKARIRGKTCKIKKQQHPLQGRCAVLLERGAHSPRFISDFLNTVYKDKATQGGLLTEGAICVWRKRKMEEILQGSQACAKEDRTALVSRYVKFLCERLEKASHPTQRIAIESEIQRVSSRIMEGVRESKEKCRQAFYEDVASIRKCHTPERHSA